MDAQVLPHFHSFASPPDYKIFTQQAGANHLAVWN
jgi:hypothetical protein